MNSSGIKSYSSFQRPDLTSDPYAVVVSYDYLQPIAVMALNLKNFMVITLTCEAESDTMEFRHQARQFF